MALQITDLVSQSAIDQLKKLNSELDKVKTTFAQVARDLAINVNVNIKGREDLENLTKVITTNFSQLSAATDKAKEAQRQFSAEIGKEVKTIKQAQQYNKGLRKARNDVNVTTDEGKRKLREYNEQINKNTRFIKDNTDAYSKQKMGIGGYFKSITKGLAVVELVKQGLGFIMDSVTKAIDSIKQFESANARLSSITGESSKGMAMLAGQALQLGMTTRYTATEVTQLQTELAKLGFRRDDILSMTDAVYKFGLATGGSMADSAALAGAMLRTFGAQADETKRYVSALTSATTKSALSFGYLEVALPIVAGGAATMGWSIEDVTALLGKLADSGMSASIAATALRNIFLKLSDTNSDMYAKFGKVENFDQFIAKLKELQESGMDLGDALELTDKRSVIPFTNLVKHGDEAIALRDSITGVGDELDAMAAKINDTVEGSIYSLKSAWEALGLAFYNSKGWIKDCIDWLTSLVRTAADAFSSIDAIRSRYYAEANMKYEDEWTNPEQKIVKNPDGSTQTVVTTKRQEVIIRAQDEYNRLVEQGVEKEKAKGMAIAEVTKSLYDEINATQMLEDIHSNTTQEQLSQLGHSPWYNGGVIRDILTEGVERKGILSADAEIMGDLKAKVDSIQKTIDAVNNWDFGLTKDDKTYTPPVSTRKAEEQARKLQKELDRLAEIQAKAEIAMTGETEDKKRLTIIAGYDKMIAEINRMELVSQVKRNAVIEELRMAMNAELLRSEEEFSTKRAQTDARNWSAAYGASRKKAYAAEQTLLDANKAKELRDAELMGYDKEAINEKYKALQFELNNKYRAYDIAMEKANVKNRLEYIESGTEEELRLRKRLLDLEYEEELKNAIKTGTDTESIRRKYLNKGATLGIERINKSLGNRNTDLDTSMMTEQSDLIDAYRRGEMDETAFNVKGRELAKKYAVERLNATISAMEEELKIANLTTDQEAEILNKMAKAKLELNQTLLDSDKATFKAMIENVEKWSSAAQDAFSAIAGFMVKQYDIEIDRLNDEKDALDEKYDADVERIERLEDQGALSTEDAEARKRAAKDRTEQKQKEIESKQQELAYKQAVWEKAASASQTTISTALGIMKVWAGEGTIATKTVMSALVAATGAMQLATILATPIPKYAKGTKGHRGGLAVVGDGGRSEFVMLGSRGWVTPSTDTLVDLPKGAVVYPDARSVMMALPLAHEDERRINVVNDYKELERRQKTANSLLRVIAVNTKGRSDYNQYKRTIW